MRLPRRLPLVLPKRRMKRFCTMILVGLLGAATVADAVLQPTAIQAGAGSFGSIRIPVYGMQLELDTRPDLDGLQTGMTAVKDFPSGVMTVVGQPGLAVQPALPAGAVVKAEISGPAYGEELHTIEGPPNGLLELPNLQVPGDYVLRNVRLEDSRGNIILRRAPGRERIRIKVIKKLLVTQVTSRALTLDEIQQKGIVIDEKNFSAVNFTVGLTLGSEKVEIDMPIAIPTPQAELTQLRPPDLTRLPSVQQAFDRINIPNFSLSGFQMRVPPDLEEGKGIELPPINGVIVIPGNIGFLNQFFSVILQATNVAPDGSELILREARATIALPLGRDGIKASGDDPLRVAQTRDHGIQESLPLLDADGEASIAPQATNQAEFLVEGLSEGTHRVDFDISGDLYIPQLGKTLPMTGEAGGLVQVRNPTFSITLAHPDVVREGEAYSIFATVTNTSSTPANLFQLGLNTRSMSGARLDDDEQDLKKLDSLGPGQAESFEFKLVAMTTGEVTGTVLLADEGINGSFILTTGVGDTGIPLSPDTLVLPKEARYLPDRPDLLFQAVRLLGQAYSVATAPAGTLPPEIPRMRKSFVFDQAVGLARAGLRTRFGQTALGAARDIAMDYLGGDMQRLDALYPDDEAAREQRRADLIAFDTLRRLADAGHDFSRVMGEMLAAQMTDPHQLDRLQQEWADVYASRPAHLSFGVSSRGPPPELRITDASGKALGRLRPADPVRRELPYAGRLPLFAQQDQSAAMLLLTAPESDSYEMAFGSDPTKALRVSLILPTAGGMEQILFPETELETAGRGVVRWRRDGEIEPRLELDMDGDGRPELTLEPEVRSAIADRGPKLLGVKQWSKGARPSIKPDFEHGDPLGRMLGLLYDEPVEAGSATDPARYLIPENHVTQIAMQPDRRLLFMVLEKPVGPFVARELTVSGVADLNGNRLEDGVRIIAPDPARGIGGRFRGQVVHADGRPVPYASVKYIQPIEKQALLSGGCMGSSEVRDAVITSYDADREGRFSIDYVLQADFPPDCPDNVDIWLNEHSPPGTQNFKLEATDPETGKIGKLSTRIHFDGQSMGLKVVIRGYGTIKGRAVDEEGNPVRGGDPGTSEALWIRARNISTGEWFSSWVDGDGNYSFPREFTAADAKVTEVPRMPTGNVILQLVRPGDGYTAVTTTNVPGGGSTVTQDLMMIPPNRYGKVSGRVMEADGVTGAANVRVQIAGEVLTGIDLYSRAYGQSVVGSTHTDREGHFSFDSIPTGPIDVRAFRQASYEQARVESHLQEGDEATLVLIFPGTGGTVRGLVRDAFSQPVPGATVAGGPTLTEADENGFFEIRGLPLGEYTIYAQSKSSPALGQVKVQTLGPKDVQEVVITLQPLGSVGGTVYQADGTTPVRSQTVQLWAEPNKGVLAETISDDRGVFRFDDYPLGNYSVRAVSRDHGDGGMTYTTLRYAGDRRDADIVFRGMGEIRGRVIQPNGTPVLSDVIVTGKVWRIFSSGEGEKGDLFLQFVRSVQSQVDEATAGQIEGALQSAGLSQPPSDFFMLVDESRLIASDARGPNGELTGEFRFSNGLAGSYKVAAFGPFLAPAEKQVEIPRTREPGRRRVDAGDVVLEPATGKVRGTVYMPDGKTPVGADVTVRIRSLDSSGSVMTATGGVRQPVLPEYSVTTDNNGRFYFPLVLRGRFTLNADTGTPERGLNAKSAGQIQTARFADDEGRRLLNVRLHGSANGVVPAGETLETEIRLLDAVGIRLKVVENDGSTPVPFARVTLRTASTLDADEEASMARVYTDKQGVVELFPVIEGRYSISAAQPLSPARGRSEGVVERETGRHQPLLSTLTLGAVTSAAGEVVKASVFGSVTGRVLQADGSAQTNPVQVTVKVAGASLLASTDDGGRFSLTDVPGGTLQIEAFEPFTARRGLAVARIDRQDQTADVTLRLIGLGTVGGTVLSSDGKLRMSGLDVILYPEGRFSDRLISRSDRQGIYELPGVPEGHYRIEVKDYENGLKGRAEGDIGSDGERRTTDVLLEPSGRISGRIFAAGVELNDRGEPQSTDAAPVAGASVLLRGPNSNQTLQTDAEGRFASTPFLPLGKYHLRVTPQQGNDGAEAETLLAYNGERKEINLALSGEGEVKGVVLDSGGEKPVKAARVQLRSRSPFSPGELTRFSDQHGKFLFDRVPVGDFEIGIRTTIAESELGARVQGRLQRHGESVAFVDTTEGPAGAIRLQPAGSIGGRVLHDDGRTPAAGAVAELRGNRIRLGRECDADGRFSFDALPLGDYRLTVLDSLSNGVASRHPGLTRNGESIEFETIVLDSKAPEVVSTEPRANSTAVDGGAPIHIRFSEALDAESVTPDNLQVRVDGDRIAGSLSVDRDLQGITFTPSRPVPDLKQVRVLVKGDSIGFEGQLTGRGILDSAGVGLPEDLLFVYTTRDATPPALVKRSPEPDANGVGLDQVVRLEFSEAIQAETLQTFRLMQNDKPVPGRLDMPAQFAGRLLVFTPGRRLQPNAGFEVTVAAPVKDMAGNALPEGGINYRFNTLDTRPPKIIDIALAAGDKPIEGKRVKVAAKLEQAPDIRLVEFYLAGRLAGSASEPPWSAEIYLDPKLGPELVVEAVAIDQSDNRSARQRLPLRLISNTPPAVRIVAPAGTQVSAGQVIALQVAASDDVGLTQIAFTANGGALAGGRRELPPSAGAQAAFSFRIPADFPIGSQIELQALATDTQGLVAGSAVVKLDVLGKLPPEVIIAAPANGESVDPGAELTVTVRAEDATGITELSLGGSGLINFNQVQEIAPATSAAERIFRVRIPEDAPATARLTLSARALDSRKNAGNRSIVLAVNDRIAPVAWLRKHWGDKIRVEPGHKAQFQVEARDEIGVVRYEIMLGEQSLFAAEVPPETHIDQYPKVMIPPDLPLNSELKLSVRVWDKAGNAGVSDILLQTTGDMTQPVVQVASPHSKQKPIKAGETLVYTLSAEDAYGLANLSYSISGPVKESQEIKVPDAAKLFEKRIEIPIPEEAKVGGQILLTCYATDQAGNRHGVNHYVTVLDEIAPELAGSDPADGTENAVPDARLTIRFSEYLDTRSVNAESLLVTGPAGPVEGRFSFGYYRPDIVYFQPAEALKRGEKYQVRVTRKITDPTGNQLKEARIFQFRTDAEPPLLVEQYPAENADGVPVNPVIRLVFSEQLKRETTSGGAVRLLDEAGAEVPAELRLGDKDKVIELHPKTVLKLASRYRIALSGSIADLAGNTILLQDGSRFESRMLRFTTGSIVFITPADGATLRENERVPIKISGEGMAIADVVYEINGQRMTPVPGPDFSMIYPLPPIDQAQSLSVLAIARDEQKREIARHSVTVPIVAALRRDPALLGLTPGSRGMLRLTLPRISRQPVRINLSSGQAEIARLPASSVTIPAGTKAAEVAVEGVKAGSTWIQGKSELGDIFSAVYVSEPVAGRELLVNSSAAALSVSPAADRLPEKGVIHAGTAISRRVPGHLKTLHIPHLGSHLVTLPLAVSDATGAATFTLRSGNEKLLSVPASVQRKAGAAGLSIAFEALAQGATWVQMSAGGESYFLPVQVQTGDGTGKTGVESIYAGLSVSPSGYSGRLHLSQLGRRNLSIQLAAEPAAADLALQVESSDASIVAVDPQASIPTGARNALIGLRALAPGEAVVKIKAGDRVTRLRVSAVELPAAYSGGSASRPTGITILQAGGGGTVYMLPGTRQTWPVRVPGVASGTERTVTIRSRNPRVAVAENPTAKLPAGGNEFDLALLTKAGASGDAVLDLQIGGRRETVRVIIVDAVPKARPSLISRAVGVELK